jgi:hypothetical protein
MKRLLKAGLTLALVAGSAGCVDLNEKLVSSLGSNYATTAQGLTDLTNGAYAQAKNYDGGDTYYGMEQMGVDTWTAADQVAAGGAQPWVYLDTYDPQYTTLAAFLNPQWQGAYQLVADANVVLDNGPNTPVGGVLTQAIKNSRLGEAYFLRAWAYFELIQQYGCGSGATCGVTVNLHTGSLSTEAKRESEDSVYKVILADLNQAISLLPVTQTDFGRATKGAAQALLAKVYLTRAYRDWNSAGKTADFQQALTLANGVINSGTYSLLPVYADLWCAAAHRAGTPPDPGRQGFCEMSGFVEANKEVIWSMQFSWDPTQYTNTATNYNPVVFLSQYDAGAGGWAAGMTRDLDNGRPFRRIRPTSFTHYLFNQTRYANGQGALGADVLDTRYDGSYQTVWFVNSNTSNPTGTCPKCTSGAPLKGTMIGSQVGAAAGSDTGLVYLGYQVTDAYRQSKAYRIGTPCTTGPGADCGKDNDAKGMYGYAHYPSLKKFQDNARPGGFNDTNGGKDRVVLRLGEMYLTAAEAALGLGQKDLAATDINVLRNRAACDPATTVKLCATSHKNDPLLQVSAGQITLDFIYDEREREMSGEMSRWEDLRRPGKDFFLARVRTWNPYGAPYVADKHYYRPIPAQQIQGVTGTPYPQSPGW